MKKIAFVGLGLLLFATTASAAEFVAPASKVNANLTFSSGENHKNLYAAGGNVTVSSDILGDLYVAGGVVTVNGKVEKDLMVAGGNINLNGQVGNNLRVVGGNISINSPVGGDLLVGGGNISISDKSPVSGDLVIGGGNISLDAPVAGNVKIGGGTVTINSKITGSVDIRASKNLIFGPKSQVLGKVVYKGPTPAQIDSGAQVGPIEYTKIESNHNAGRAVRSLFALATLIKLIALLIAGFVLYYFFPRKIDMVVAHSHEKTLKSLGIGFLFLVVSPILAILLCITVIGFYLGAIVFLLYVLTLILAAVFMLFYTGSLLYSWYKKDAPQNLKRDLVVGAIAILIVSLIPFIGWLATGIVYLIALGSFVIHMRDDQMLRN